MDLDGYPFPQKVSAIQAGKIITEMESSPGIEFKSAGEKQMIDTTGMAFPKPGKRPKESKGLKSKKPLKSNSKPIPLELKREVLKVKGNFCLMGFCPNCGGRARVTEHDDGHHWPHRSRGGKDCIEHIWIMRHECHMFLHDNPLMEKQVFGEILSKANEKLKKVAGNGKETKIRKTKKAS